MNCDRSRKRFLPSVICALIIVIIMSGCGEGASGYREIDIELPPEPSDNMWLCWQKSDTAIFAVGPHASGSSVGPSYSTDKLIVYDLKAEAVIATYEVNTAAYIYAAAPYQDGILYVDYIGDSYSASWSLVFQTDNGKCILDKGAAETSFDRVPMLFMLQDTPFYLWEGSYCSNNFGINRITNSGIESIYEENGSRTLADLYVKSYGEHYCFAAYDFKGEVDAVVGDMDGVLYSQPLDGKLTSYTIAENYAIYGTAMDVDTHTVYGAAAIELVSGECTISTTTNPLYRLAGGGKDTCLFVDSHFAPYSASVPDLEAARVPLPEEIENTGRSVAVSFYPLGGTNFLAEFSRIINGQEVRSYYEYGY